MSYRTRYPIHFAAMTGDLSAVTQAVLNSPIMVDDLDVFGDTLLHTAAEFGHLQMARFLLDNRADVNARNEYDFTPLHRAAENGTARAARARSSQNLLPGLSGGWLEAFVAQSKTPQQKIGTIRLLLDRGADARAAAHAATSTRGRCTPLYHARDASPPNSGLLSYDEGIQWEVFQLLTQAERQAHSLFRAAISADVAQAEEYLNIEKSLLPDRYKDLPGYLLWHEFVAQEDGWGMTALDMAAEIGAVDIVRLLLNWGAMTWPDPKINPPPALRLAERNGHTAVQSLLQEWALTSRV